MLILYYTIIESIVLLLLMSLAQATPPGFRNGLKSTLLTEHKLFLELQS